MGLNRKDDLFTTSKINLQPIATNFKIINYIWGWKIHTQMALNNPIKQHNQQFRKHTKVQE